MDSSHGTCVCALWNFLSDGVYGFIVPGTRTFAVFGSSGGIDSGIRYQLAESSRLGFSTGLPRGRSNPMRLRGKKKGILLLVATVCLLTGYWGFGDGGLVEGGRFELEIAAVRAMANERPGPKPIAIHVEDVADFEFPKTFSVAGASPKLFPMAVYSYKVVFPDGHLVIDTGFGKANAPAIVFDFHSDSYDRVIAALGTATAVVLTHEHVDHIGGLIGHPKVRSLLPRVHLTQAQVDAPESIRPRFVGGLESDVQPLRYEHLHPLAPGVVLIKAPGHTPGSQMIYVQLSSGREVLFLGDTVWLDEGLARMALRARLLSLFLGEDRAALSAQLRALSSLREAEPELIQVAGHDRPQTDALVAEGHFVRGF